MNSLLGRSRQGDEATLHVPVLLDEFNGELQAGGHDNPQNREHFGGRALISLQDLFADATRKVSAGSSVPRSEAIRDVAQWETMSESSGLVTALFLKLFPLT